jgi:hypothetical protein
VKIQRLTADPVDILQFYDKLSELSDIKNGLCEPTMLTNLIINHQYYWRLGDVGYLSLYPIDEDQAHIHVLFWDRRLRGRETLVRNHTIRLLNQYGYKYLWTSISRHNRVTVKFAERAGMKVVAEQGDLLVFFTTKDNLIAL